MKKVLSILLVATSLFALVGCGGKTENLQKEVDALKQSLAELQATVSSQNQTITDQTGKLAELEAAKAAQAETIAAQTEKLEQLENLLNERESLAEILLPKGAFYSLQTAYDNGWITEEEVAHIAYLYNNKSKDEEVNNYVYDSSHIDDFLLYSMKKTYVEEKIKTYPDKEDKMTINNLRFGSFFGEYGNCIVFSLYEYRENVYVEYVWEDKTIANSLFEDYNIAFLYVWYPIEE